MGDLAEGLSFPSDALRRFQQDWLRAPPREDQARQEFAELLLGEELSDLDPPSLPGALACSARLTPAVYCVWRLRADLQTSYDLSTVPGYFGLLVWLVRHGWNEYPTLRARLPDSAPSLSAPWPTGEADGRLTQFACALWLAREDLQGRFPITSIDGRTAFAEWFLKKGAVELQAWPVLSPSQADWLQRLESPKSGDPVPVARFLLGVWASRSDLQATIPLARDRWGARLWEWYFTSGITELGVTPEWVLRCASSLERAGVGITWR